MSKARGKAQARENRHTPERLLFEPMSPEQALEKLETLSNPFVLIIDGVQDPHNLGACLRSADAAGVDIVFAPEKHTVGLTETVRRIACGGADRVPYIQVGNLGQIMDRLKSMGIWLVGTGDEESQLLYQVDMQGPLAIVMGSEAKGLRQKIAERCDHLVRIPMLGKTDCLNLSVATGVCLFEAVRQRLPRD